MFDYNSFCYVLNNNEIRINLILLILVDVYLFYWLCIVLVEILFKFV